MQNLPARIPQPNQTERPVRRGKLLHIERDRPSTVRAPHRPLLCDARLLDDGHEQRPHSVSRSYDVD